MPIRCALQFVYFVRYSFFIILVSIPKSRLPIHYHTTNMAIPNHKTITSFSNRVICQLCLIASKWQFALLYGFCHLHIIQS